ncbi:MAG: hypothetical protein WC833_11050 [Bacteroidales bacterium]|jgi:hypothetical protein
MKLLTTQKDILYELIEENPDFTPMQFELNDLLRGNISLISHNNSQFYFKITSSQNYADYYHADFSPGQSSLIASRAEINFSDICISFRIWLSCLNKELKSPNKWHRLQHEIQSVDIKFSYSNHDVFTYAEYEDISSRIQELKKGIRAISFTQDQFNVIDSKLDLLVESAKTASKFDWGSFFFGTIVNIILQLGVTPENASSLWALIKTTFSNLLLIK